jgi:hypothetical protein
MSSINARVVIGTLFVAAVIATIVLLVVYGGSEGG